MSYTKITYTNDPSYTGLTLDGWMFINGSRAEEWHSATPTLLASGTLLDYGPITLRLIGKKWR